MDIFCITKLKKKTEQNLIDVPPPANVNHANTKIELKRDILKCVKKFLSHIYIYIYIHMVVENYTKDLKESLYYSAGSVL